MAGRHEEVPAKTETARRLAEGVRTLEISISKAQEKRVEKIARLREYFKADTPEIYEWSSSDEQLDFALMADPEIAAYLRKSEK